MKELNVGDTMQVGTYNLKMVDLKQGENENYAWHRAIMQVSKDGEELGTLEPEKRFYKASRQGTSRSRHPPAPQRRSVPEFRRHVATTTSAP